MMKKTVFAFAGLLALSACDEQVAAPVEGPAPSASLSAEESQSVGLLAQSIAEEMNRGPKSRPGSSFRFLGAEVQGTRIIMTDQSDRRASSYTSSSVFRFRNSHQRVFQDWICDPRTGLRPFIAVGGEVESRIIDSGRQPIVTALVTRC